MPQSVLDFLQSYGGIGAFVTFLFSLVGGSIALFQNGTLVLGSNLRLVQEVYKLQLEELHKQLDAMTKDRDRWMDVGIRGAEAGRVIITETSKPDPEKEVGDVDA